MPGTAVDPQPAVPGVGRVQMCSKPAEEHDIPPTGQIAKLASRVGARGQR